MKSTIWFLLLVLGSGPGCLMLPQVAKTETPVKQGPPEPPPPPPIVLAEEVTEANYPQKINALRAEIDTAATQRPPSQPLIHTVDDNMRR